MSRAAATPWDAPPANAVSPGLIEIDLALTKTHTQPFALGTNRNYNFSVTSVGALTTTGAITVTDNLPVGLTYRSVAGSGWSCSAAAQLVTCTNPGPLSQGQVSTFAISVAVSPTAPAFVLNTATVSTPGEPAGFLGNNTASDPTTIYPDEIFVDLAMAKSHTGNFVVNQNGTYTLAVTNVGTTTTTGPISVTDVLPAGLTFVSAAAPWACSGTQTVTCTVPGPLARNASTSTSMVVAVSGTAASPLVNTATVTTAGDVNAANNTATDPTTIERPDLSITKTASPSPFVVGLNTTYSLAVSNVGTAASSGTTTITDVLPPGLTFFSWAAAPGSGWTCNNPPAGTVTCSNPNPFAPGAPPSVVTVTVVVDATAGATVTNTATLTNPSDQNPANNSATRTDPVRRIDLTIAKSHTGNFVAGQNGTYTLTVTNLGDLATTGPITVTDALPAGLTFVPPSTAWNCSATGQAVTCTVPGPLAPNATASAALTVAVAATAPTQVVNRATVSTTGDANPANNTATDPTTIDRPDLSIAKTASPSPFVVGQNASYGLAVSNVGTAPSSGTTTITDVLPAGLTFFSTSAPAGWTCANQPAGTVTCTNPNAFAPGAPASVVTVTVVVGAGVGTSVTNTATLTNPSDLNPANNTATRTDPVRRIDLTIAKTHTGDFAVGQNGTYTLTVTNLGDLATTGPITVTDVLPAGLAFVPPSAGWNCSATGQVVTCTVPGPLAPNATASTTLTVAPSLVAAPQVVNQATVTTTGDSNPGNNTATDPTNVLRPNLQIIKTASPGTFVVGQNATYRLSVRNVGTGPSSGITTITDVVPKGLTFVSWSAPSGSGWTCNNPPAGTITCDNPNVFAAGAPASLVTVTVVVGSGAGTSVTNTATVQTLYDSDPTNNTSTVTNPVGTVPPPALGPDLELTKRSNGTFVVGYNGSYTLTVTNVGDTATSGPITVKDSLRAGLTFVPPSTGASCSASAPQLRVILCTVQGPLAPGDSRVIGLTVLADSSAAPLVWNSATVTTGGDTNRKNDTDSVSTVVDVPDLKIAKTLTGRFSIGDTATYALTVTNVSRVSTSRATTITDVLPAGLTYVSSSGPGWTCTNQPAGTIKCTTPAILGAGASSTVTIRVLVGGPAPRSVTNTGLVRTYGDTNTTNDRDSVTTTVNPPDPNVQGKRPDLETVKTASASAFTVGQPASYTITVTNKGDTATSAPVTLTDSIPAGLTQVTASGAGWDCTVTGSIVTCTLRGALAVGQSAIVTVNAVPVASAVPQVRNKAWAKTVGDSKEDNDSSTVTTPVGAVVDLALTKRSVGEFKVNAQARYALTVTNNGLSAATGPVTVRDTLPSGVTFVSATGTGWACSASGAAVTCTRSTGLAAGESSVIDLVVTLAPASLPAVTNCATVSGPNETGFLANNRGCDQTVVSGEPLLKITKSVSRKEVEIGDVLDYTLVVRNDGTRDADAIVTDDLPRGFAYEARSARLGGAAIAEPAGAPGPRLSFAIGVLRVNVPVTVTYRVRVTAAAPLGNNVNVAVVRSTDGKHESTVSTASTRVSGGLFDERGAIAGKVYTQCNCESVMQEAGEVGIPGVRVYLEDGTSAVTDVEGKYSFYNVSSRMHVVKVDRASLPRGAVMVAIGNRNALDGYSRFADVKGGELHKADFAEGSGSADVLQLVLARRRAGEVENAGTQISDRGRAPQLAGGAAAPAAGAPSDSIRIAYTAPVSGVMVSQDSGSGPMRPDQAYQPLRGAGTLTDRNSQLPATPLRAQAAQQGRNPLGYGRVELDVPQVGIPADGQSLVSIEVRLMDRDGKALTGRVPVTLESSLGRWLGDETNATEQGRQVVVDGGVGRFTLRAASQAGRGEVRATTPDGSLTMPITFVPVARPFMASGLLNARLDLRSLIRGGNALAPDANGFEEALRDWTFDNDSGKVRGGARGALLLKGRVAGNQLLTLSYDSERDRGRTLFRDIRPDEFFPIYGDASLREFDAQSRRRFFARLDRGPSYTMFGDFQTARADERRMLTAYDRTLNGVSEHIEGKRGAATLFASQGRSRQAVDEIPGRGISGPYVLSAGEGLINSERVEIITRDRNQPSVILSRVPLTRFADYTIEPLTGRLLLRAPVPSADANLNPVSIRVTYESETAASDKYWIYGGNASLRLSDAFELGGTFAQDENPLLKSRLAGVNATAQFSKSTYAFGEFAQTDRDGEKGDAFRVELRHQSGRLEGRLFAARSDSAFSNTSSTFFGGRTEVGGRFSAGLDDRTRLVGEALRTENNTGRDGQRDGLLLAIERQLNKSWRAEIGYRYAKESGNYTPYPGGTPLQVNPGVIDRDVSAVRGRLSWTLPEKTRSSLFAEYEQDVRDESHRGAVGGEYLISNLARVYGRHEWLTGVQGAYATNEGTDQQYTVFGVDADYFKNTQMFSEYRARDAFAGRDAEASIGLRNRWAIAPGLLVNTSFERVSPLFGTVGSGVNASTGDALAATGAVEWTRPSLWKSTARLEFRDADNGDNFLASFGYARKLSRDWTLLGRTLWDVFDAQQDQTRGWSQLGVAWRETDRNKWNALVRYENRLAHLGSNGVTPATENLAHILAGLVNYQPVGRVTLSGRYAAKVARDEIGTISTRTTSQLFMGRSVFDLNRRLDAGLIGSLLASDGFSARRYGLGGELGLIVIRNLRVAGGYNVFGFTDKDLNSFGTTRKGAYLELGFKFDESLFGIGGNEVPCDNACRAGGKKE